MIFCKKEHASAIDRAVFPGLQGGPHNHVTAAIAVAANEAGRPEFKTYAKNVVDNARALGGALAEAGFGVITGGTDNHLLLVDVTSKGTTGKQLAQALDRAGIVLNYNAVPFDPRKPFDPSGVRIGTPSVTTRGMGKDVMLRIADWITRVTQKPTDDGNLARIASEVKEVCAKYPAPGVRVG
jgi:glycine hydroxymethyltransferase